MTRTSFAPPYVVECVTYMFRFPIERNDFKATVFRGFFEYHRCYFIQRICELQAPGLAPFNGSVDGTDVYAT